jgi:hypothetical protein
MPLNTKFFENLNKIKGRSGMLPNSILIDKNGNIANPDAKRPSSKERLYQQIDALL